MSWEQVTALLSVLVTATIGLLTYFRGRRSDEALSSATNVKSAFEAQADLIDALQEDIRTQREWLHACEETCRHTRMQLDERTRLFNAQELEIANLKSVIYDHEQEISRLRRTVDIVSRREEHLTSEENRRRRRETDQDE
jgi:chromosome segregation ATPase